MLDALGKNFIEAGINTQLAHRISAMSAFGGGLPHSSALINALTVIKMSYKDCYRHYFFVGVIIRLICTIVAIIFGGLGII